MSLLKSNIAKINIGTTNFSNRNGIENDRVSCVRRFVIRIFVFDLIGPYN